MAVLLQILSLAAIVLAPGWLHAEESRAFFLTALEQGKRQRIVVYGTSLTASAAWPGDLQTTLRASYGSKAKVINAACGGMDSRWGMANLSNRVLRQRPDVVFLEFTINDALAESRLTVAESMANLTSMLTQIRQESPDCDLVVMIMNPPTGEAWKKRPNINAYAAGYRRVAKKLSCRLIDFSPIWNDLIKHHPDRWNTYAPDGLHPNKLACREVILPRLLEKVGHPAPARR
ncbi:MAG: SGNH/GDSL hydrolase family protein [Verrucomicrobiota bacterium]